MVVAPDEMLVRLLIIIGFGILHAILLGKALYLSVAEHRQAGHGEHRHADTKIFITPSKLRNSGIFIGIIHEVDIALENFRVKFKRVLDQVAIIGIILLFKHVHECAVIDPVHAKCADKIAFEHPERFSKQQGIGDFKLNTVNYLAPELFGYGGIKFRHAHGIS